MPTTLRHLRPWQLCFLAISLLLGLLLYPLRQLMRWIAIQRRLPWTKMVDFIVWQQGSPHPHESQYLCSICLMYLRNGRFQEALLAAHARYGAAIKGVTHNYRIHHGGGALSVPSARAMRKDPIKATADLEQWKTRQTRLTRQRFINAYIALQILEWSKADGDINARAMLQSEHDARLLARARELDKGVAGLMGVQPQSFNLALQDAEASYKRLVRKVKRDAKQPIDRVDKAE